MRTILALLLSVVLLASCNQYKKTPSGLAYKITKGDGKVPLKNGMYVKFHIKYTIPPKDSVLNSSYGHVPGFLLIDTARMGRHNFTEIITQCAVGDKVEFNMSIDTLKKLGMVQYNEIFRPRDMIKGQVEFLQAYKTQEEVIADRGKEMQLEADREKKELAKYAADKKLKTQSTPSGTLVEIETPGDLSNKADSGRRAAVRYKGTLLNGKVPFDQNMDANGPNRMPLLVDVGSVGTPNSVITGLDQALRLFGKGGKGKVYIPAMAGYGDQGNPPVIPPYSTLVFEIEVTDVTPSPAPAPMMPGQPQKQ